MENCLQFPSYIIFLIFLIDFPIMVIKLLLKTLQEPKRGMDLRLKNYIEKEQEKLPQNCIEKYQVWNQLKKGAKV